MRNSSHPANPFFNAQLAQLDTLRYRVHATTTLAEEARLTATVTALVPNGAAEDDLVCARVQSALRHFIATEWAVTPLDRVSDAPGYVQVTLHASARLAPAERFDLEARARGACREGVVLSNLEIAGTPAPAAFAKTVAALRERTLTEIERHIAGISYLSGRRWRVGDLRFGADTTTVPPRPGTTAQSAECDPAGNAEAESEDRIVLVTEVVLRAESLTLH